MQVLTLQDVMSAFDPIDRPQVTEPHLHEITSWSERDFLAWRHPGESKSFLVVPLEERLVGLVMTMSQAAHAGVCDLCLSVDRESGTCSALVQTWARPRTSYGIAVCSGLTCSESVRGLRWTYRLGETITIGRRIERLQENVERFARAVSGIGRTGS